MAEVRAAATVRSPLDDVSLPSRRGKVEARAAPPTARFVCRGEARALAGVLGLDLSAEPMRAITTGERAALWLGPDEWLLLAPLSDAPVIAGRWAAREAGVRGSLVDVGHRSVGLLVVGPAAGDLLASGCPLDLDLQAFPVGMCTRTLLGKAEIVLWRTAADGFRLEVARSYAPYVAGYLTEAANDL